MKMYYLFIFLFSLTLVSCGSEETVTETVEVPAMRASHIYRADSVLSYIAIYKDDYKDLSDSYEKKSEEIQDKDLARAIYYCKRAITIHPTYDLYHTLGSLLVKDKRYEEAYRLYSFLVDKHYFGANHEEVYVFTDPTEDMHYEKVALNILNYGMTDAYDIYLYKDQGLDLKKLKNRLLADERLKIDTTAVSYKDFKLMFMSEEEIEEYKSGEQVYRGFLSSIKDTSAVFEINAKQVQNFKYNTGDDYEMGDGYLDERAFYVNFLQEKKDHPDQWYNYNYTHIYPLYNNVTAVVYAIDTSDAGCPKDMRHIYHRLVLYSDKGEILDHKVIAFQSGEDLATATVHQSDITVKFFKRKWRNPYKKNDFDNDLLSAEEVGSVSYKLNAEGKIVQRGNQPETAPAAL
jgi:hypothetical protein